MQLDSICGRLIDYRGDLGEQCVILEKGYIKDYAEEPRGKYLDLRGSPYFIFPGIIDLHVHLRGLKLSYKEDERSGTLQALKAGITLIIDMPNTEPPLITKEALLEKLRKLEYNSYIDYSVYAGIPTDSHLIKEISTYPIAGFKAFPKDYEKLKNKYIRDAIRDKLLIVHPEDPITEKLPEIESVRQRSVIRNCPLETIAIDYISEYINLEGKVHITHVSCHSTVDRAKELGYTVDVTPHHLYYDYNQEGCIFRVNPPLRDPSEIHYLLEYIYMDKIDAFASDHAPHSQIEKSEPLSCRPGFPWLPLWPWLLHRILVKTGFIDLKKFAWLTSKSPATILGLEDYGELSPGFRANLIIVDPRVRWRFPGFIDSKHRLPVHFMEELAGLPIYTIVGGSIVWDFKQGIVRRGRVLNPFKKNTQ